MLKRILLVLVVLLLAAGVFYYPKLKKVYWVMHLFDKENIAPFPEKTELLHDNQPIIKREISKRFDDKVVEPRNVMDTPRMALEPKFEKAWTKLTALARGFLVRRLMATEKVQSLKRTIKDRVACAVKLHLDSGNLIL